MENTLQKSKNVSTNSPSLGFRFNRAEETAIQRACRHAKQFMSNYGKGRKPLDPLAPYYLNIQ